MKILCEISLGELIDKLIILSLKKEFIKDEHKLLNVCIEHNALHKIYSDLKLEGMEIFVDKLASLHKELWFIEEEMRIKEKKQEFDERFIVLARSVYIKNDIRSAIKKDINIKYGSNIIEEKSY